MIEVEREQKEAQRAAEEGGAGKDAYVRRMFSAIAPSYDLLNHLLSVGIDRRWRRRALRALQWERAPEGVYLDVCAGTLDVAATLATTPGFGGSIIASDFAEPMLRSGLKKVQSLPVCCAAGDALRLPLRDRCADGALIAFGVRNLADIDAGLNELHRVLRPGARFVILEFTTPRNPLVRGLYHLYFRRILPLIGGLVSGHKTAYRYLPASVAHFPSERELAGRMQGAGFHSVSWESLSMGVAAIHCGTRS